MDLVVASVSGASVTIVVAIAIGYLSIKLSRAQSELASALVLHEKAEAEVSILKAQNNALTDRMLAAEKRLKDADALIAEMGSQLPVSGSYERLLRAWQITRTITAARNDNAEPVRDGSKPPAVTASGTIDDGLVKPGDDP